MPSAKRNLDAQISEYLDAKTRRRQLDQEYARKYRRILTHAMQSLMDAGLPHTPPKIGEREVDYLLGTAWAHTRPNTQKGYVSILSGYLHYNGNDVVERMMLGWPTDVRTNVDWLSPEEAVLLLEAAEGVERLVVHLELRLWMRRVEVQRLTVQDVKNGVLDVHGKGRGGGKWRTIAYAPETYGEFLAYEELREQMIERARHFDPWVNVPDSYLIYQKGKRLSGYGHTAIDNMVAAAARRAGIDRVVSNHDLRRTGARLAYYAGVPLVEIKEGLGHSNMEQTVRYLGLPVELLTQAQLKVAEYLEKVKREMREGPGPCKISVPSRILR